MEVLITLTTAGDDTGPFNLFSDTDSFTTPFESSISKIDLVNGFTSLNAPSGTTIVRVQSISVLCTNYIDIILVTSTTTTTSTQPLFSVFTVSFKSPVPSLTGYEDGGLACAGTGTYVLTLYSDPSSLTFQQIRENGKKLYTDPSLDPSTAFNGGVINNWYKTISPVSDQAIRIDEFGSIDQSVFIC